MDEHRSARSILRHALVGGVVEGVAKGAAAVDPAAVDPAAVDFAAIDPAELERALAHVASCEECRLRFDVAETAAWLESREETQAMAQAPVDPAALFEHALTTALSDPDDITRRRAAERLGEMTALGAAAVHALVATAGEDRDERVRAAALTAVQHLDTTVSLPQWAIDVWSATPAEAGPYLADVLARLAGPAGATSGVIRLTSAGAQDDEAVTLAGEHGLRARVTHEPDGLWLTVDGLSGAIEHTRPVVAVPKALESDQTAISWAGDEPGLVAAIEPVSGGSLRVRLGDAGTPPGVQSSLFDQIFLLHPEDRREKA